MDLACLISARNLGDAVGHAQALEQLAARRYARRFLVWTKPESAFLFEKISDCDVVTCRFPIGTATRFAPSDLAALWRAGREVRRRVPDVTIDLVGDVRERWLARLAGSRRHLHIGWAADHPYANLIRNPFGPGRPTVTIPASLPNVYAAQDLFVRTLCGNVAATGHRIAPKPLSARMRIGLHPFASQNCKLWPLQNWEALAGSLLSAGHRLTAFAAPSELAQLRDACGRHVDDVALVTRPLREFDDAVAALDLMIGLDSFSVHIAHRHAVRTIMLNAGNPPTLWQPPEGATLCAGSLCARHPCYNVPRCEKGKRFICIRGLTVERVVDEVAQILARDRASADILVEAPR